MSEKNQDVTEQELIADGVEPASPEFLESLTEDDEAALEKCCLDLEEMDRSNAKRE